MCWGLPGTERFPGTCASSAKNGKVLGKLGYVSCPTSALIPFILRAGSLYSDEKSLLVLLMPIFNFSLAHWATAEA